MHPYAKARTLLNIQNEVTVENNDHKLYVMIINCKF